MTMHTIISNWAVRNGVTPAALQELLVELRQATLPATTAVGMSEAAVQQRARFALSAEGGVAWRNNVGVMTDERGVPVRYGLCNDSAQLNARFKSSDLIGLKPVMITPAHVGHVIGQFWARECKAAGWRYAGSPREKAQLSFLELVNSLGGDAKFTNGDVDAPVTSR